MSRTRFDRKPRREEWDSDYTALGGGLDQSSSALSIKPGRLIGALNWEQIFGKQGYATVKGYERFDGRARPSTANYTVVYFDTGTVTFAQGDAVSNLAATASGTVVSQTVESGSFGGGDAAGYLILCLTSGTFADNDALRVGGATLALANGAPETGSIGFGAHQTAITATRTYLRGLIQVVPGAGDVLGVAVYNGVVYAVRNIVGNASATLWKSSAAGWSSVKTGLHPGGAYRFIASNFTGDPLKLYLYGVNGRGRLFRIDTAGTYTASGLIYGSEATATDNVAYGLGAKNFTVQTGKNYVATDAITAWDSANAANYMAGTVTSYNSGTGALEMNVTSFSGTGSNAAWEFGKTDYSDKPFKLIAHKNHLFLAFPRGQVQTSALGDPLLYTGGTVAAFGMGSEVTDFVSLRGKALGVFCRDQIQVLSGSSSVDWDMGPYSAQGSLGGIAGTAQDFGGNPLFLSSLGLSTLQATQAFGDYAGALLSRDAKKYLDDRITSVVGSRMATTNQQYRLYFNTGDVLRATINSAAETIGPKDISFLPSQYEHVPTCFASGVMTDDSKDRMFFGTPDGYVMEEDAGTSYDGTAVQYVLRLPFNHFKSAQFIKEFKKLELELEVLDPTVTLYFRQLFEYDDSTYRFGAEVADASGVGGQFDVSSFDTFQFDRPTVARTESPIDGQGRNMALLIFFSSDYYQQVVLQGVLTYFIKLGMQR